MTEQLEYYEQKLRYELDSWDLADLLKQGANVLVIDMRSSESYANEHIPGAINLPHRTITPESTTHLSKETLHISYCDGIGCNASTKGALKLAALGFKVKELTGGLDWWKRDGHETEGINSIKGSEISCNC